MRRLLTLVLAAEFENVGGAATVSILCSIVFSGVTT